MAGDPPRDRRWPIIASGNATGVTATSHPGARRWKTLRGFPPSIETSRGRALFAERQALAGHQHGQARQAAPGIAGGLALDLRVDALGVDQQLVPARRGVALQG